MNKLLHKKTTLGFTFIEFVLFITVLGITSTGLFVVLANVLRGSGDPNRFLAASALAESQMELILFKKAQDGCATSCNPCAEASPPAACTPLTNFASSQNLTIASPVSFSPSGDHNTIAITINFDSKAYQLQTRVSQYD